MALEEHTVEDALPQHCEVCGVQLTSQEIEAARESQGPFLCTTHAAEELPVEDDAGVGGPDEESPAAGG